MLAFKTKIPYFFIDWFIILNEENFQQKAAAKVLRKMKAPNGSFLYKKCFTACHGADIAPLVYTFLWIGNKPICEDIIIVLNLLKLKVLKIIVILLGISKKVVTLSFALNDDYGKHFTDI